MTNYQNQQYKNKNQQQQKEQYQDSNTTSSTTIHTEPGVSAEPLIKMQVESLVVPFEQTFRSRGLPPAIGQYFSRLIRAGMEPAVIASAIYATAWARVPTPYYMRAILQRYLSEGIMTQAQLDHDQFEQATRRSNQVDALEDLMYFD